MPALWVTGLASPLLFDSYVVIAHTLGAAAAGGAVLAALSVVEGPRPRALAGLAVSVGAAVLLRSEALLLALALAAACGVIGVRRRSSPSGRPAWGALAASAVAVGMAVAATLVERAWASAIVGGQVTSSGGGPTYRIGFLAARAHSFALTWLRPSYGDAPAVDMALVVMVAALALAAFAIRRHPGDDAAARLLTGFAAGAAVAALVLGPRNLVPGLLLAFPLAAFGLLLLGRDALATLPARLAAGTFGLFALAVIATQYATGGSGEWGGRYFSMGLPLLVPVVLEAVRRQRERLGVATFRRVVGAVAVCSAALAVMSLSSIRSTHRFTGRLMVAVERAGEQAGASGKPVVVTTEAPLPRLAWATFDHQRWLLAEPGELGDVLDRLAAAGRRRIVLVTGPDSAAELPPVEVVSSDAWGAANGWQIRTIALSSPRPS
jgi:hypothetical protein